MANKYIYPVGEEKVFECDIASKEGPSWVEDRSPC
jgi:hypothetical protein